MRSRYFMLIFAGLVLFMTACTVEPQQVEITRLVEREIPVTVEVTRVITQVSLVEVEVEATRLVEVVVTATPEPVVEAELETEETAFPAAAALPTPVGTLYVVRAGDTLNLIATRTGTAVADILAANNLTNAAVIFTGQQLLIPDWDGVERVVAPPPTATASAPSPAPNPSPPPPPPPPGPQVNLLPNPSFEGDWYFAGFNELQIPVGWQVATDEGQNNLSPGSGGLFARPEIRVVPAADLPPAEHGLFIFDGTKTLKAFKGYAPTSFSLFTDLNLTPGRYRLVIRYFADAVEAYSGSTKIYAADPQAAEIRAIHNNGGTGWQGTTAGQRSTLTYDFTVTEAGVTRVGASFRNRYALTNNGWFLDHWELYAIAP